MASLDSTNSNYAALKAELTTDPKTLGLTAATAVAAADKLNLVGASSETVADRKVIQSWEVMGAIDITEWGNLFASITVAQRAWFDDLVASGNIDASNARIRAGLGAIFTNAAAPLTRAALLALQNRSASRAEVLFGSGTVIGFWDVDRARAS